MALLNLLMKRKDESKDSDDLENPSKRPRYWTDEEHMRFLGAMKVSLFAWGRCDGLLLFEWAGCRATLDCFRVAGGHWAEIGRTCHVDLFALSNTPPHGMRASPLFSPGTLALLP